MGAIDTGHFKAVVTKPQNVMVMRDVACAGYQAGCNTMFFARDYSKAANATDAFNIEMCKENMMNRLSFAHDLGHRYASMLAFPAWAEQFESGHLDTVMSITTRLLPWEVNSASGGGTHNSFPGGQAMYELYNRKLQLRQVHFGEDMRAVENQEFISQARPPAHPTPCVRTRGPAHARSVLVRMQGSTNNATCFQGPYRAFDPFNKSFMTLMPGQGHFGPDALPGDARWRRGESVSLETARAALVHGMEFRMPQ